MVLTQCASQTNWSAWAHTLSWELTEQYTCVSWVGPYSDIRLVWVELRFAWKMDKSRRTVSNRLLDPVRLNPDLINQINLFILKSGPNNCRFNYVLLYGSNIKVFLWMSWQCLWFNLHINNFTWKFKWAGILIPKSCQFHAMNKSVMQTWLLDMSLSNYINK